MLKKIQETPSTPDLDDKIIELANGLTGNFKAHINFTNMVRSARTHAAVTNEFVSQIDSKFDGYTKVFLGGACKLPYEMAKARGVKDIAYLDMPHRTFDNASKEDLWSYMSENGVGDKPVVFIDNAGRGNIPRGLSEIVNEKHPQLIHRQYLFYAPDDVEGFNHDFPQKTDQAIGAATFIEAAPRAYEVGYLTKDVDGKISPKKISATVAATTSDPEFSNIKSDATWFPNFVKTGGGGFGLIVDSEGWDVPNNYSLEQSKLVEEIFINATKK